MACLTFERVASSSVGFKTDNIAEMNDRRSRLSAQTRLLSDRLEGQGIPAYDLTQTMFTIGEVTGDIERINGRYRHIQLLPEVAQKDRANMVKALTYFMQNHHARKFFRYAVLTNGERCEYGGISSNNVSVIMRIFVVGRMRFETDLASFYSIEVQSLRFQMLAFMTMTISSTGRPESSMQSNGRTF